MSERPSLLVTHHRVPDVGESEARYEERRACGSLSSRFLSGHVRSVNHLHFHAPRSDPEGTDEVTRSVTDGERSEGHGWRTRGESETPSDRPFVSHSLRSLSTHYTP
eukprot:s425_g13.t1